MIKRVGITGGIGSGKSHICREMGYRFAVPIYYSDIKGRELMEHDSELRRKIINEFGGDSYEFELGHFVLNKPKFVELLFKDESARKKMNSFVHPTVRNDFYTWCKHFPDWINYVLFESAILFDSEDRVETDFNILVVADLDIRIKRVQERNNISADEVMNRINSQTSDDYKRQFSDYIITNNGDEKELDRQIDEVHQKILSL